MRLASLLFACFLLSHCVLPPGGIAAAQDAPKQETADAEEIVVVGDGAATLGEEDAAAAEEEAVWDAKRNAVEQAVGVFIKAKAVGRDHELVEDEIRGHTNGFVKRWEIVPNSRRIETLGNGRVLRLKIRAVVALLPLIRRLADIRDVYEDMERPRLRVEMTGGEAQECRLAAARMVTALRAQGFEVVAGESAEIVLSGRLDSVPTVRLGDKDAPYGVGQSLAACHARLTMQVQSVASEEVLLTMQAESDGRSFDSDAAARTDAAERASRRLIEDTQSQFVPHLLVRWARERQEGHTVAIQVNRLNSRNAALLHDLVTEMRGFRHLISETEGTAKLPYTVRFVTRLDTRAIRRRLQAALFSGQTLTVTNDRGPLILCAVTPPAGIAPVRPSPAPVRRGKAIADSKSARPKP